MIHLHGKTLSYVRTAVNYYLYAILGLIMSIPGPTLIDLEHSSRTNSYGVSFIYIARSTGYLAGSLSGGFILDCLKREEIALVLSSLFVALGSFVIPWCRNLPMLLATFAITGFAIGFSNTGSNASCLRIWGKKSAPILQGLHLLYGLGALLAPLIAAPFLENFVIAENATMTHNESSTVDSFLNESVIIAEKGVPSITFAYTIVGVLSTLVSCCFVLVFLFVSPTKDSSTKDSGAGKIPHQPHLFVVAVVILACTLTGLCSGIEVSFTQLLTSYVVNGSHRLSKSTGSYITSAYWSSYTATRFISIFLAWKVSIKKILVCSLVLAVSAAIVLLTFGVWSVTALWVGASMLGIAMAPLFPGVLAWVERYININNRIASVFTLISCILEMVVPFTLSMYLISYPKALFIFLTGATTLASIIFVGLNIILNRQGEKDETVKVQPPVQRSAVV